MKLIAPSTLSTRYLDFAKKMMVMNASHIAAMSNSDDPSKMKLLVSDPNAESSYVSMPPSFFTNENDSYISDHIKGSSALVITGGGDQIVDLARRGFTYIMAVDTNMMQIYVAVLKLYSIINLDYYEFDNFWKAESPDCFNFETIHKIFKDESNDICKATFAFWKEVFQRFAGNAKAVRYNCILGESNFINHNSTRSVQLAYHATPKEYKKVQNRLRNDSLKIEFICQDINKFETDEKFDFVTFSNIFNFCDPDDYVELVSKFMDNNLKPDGKIVTYVIQLLDIWFTRKEARIPMSNISSRNPEMIQVALDQQLTQAHVVYAGLAKRYKVSFVKVKTGKGYSAIYRTPHDTVMMCSMK